jgi:hypothetical protein
MKTFGLAVVLLFFVTCLAYSQESKVTFEDKLYFKGGYAHSYRSATGFVQKDFSQKGGPGVYPSGWADVFTGTAGYKLNNRVSIEVSYEYMNGLSFSETVLHRQSIEESYYSTVETSYKAHEVSFKGTLFVNDDRNDDPVYFIGGLTFALQPVNNRFVDEFEDRTETILNSYNRFAAGLVAGFGIFWDTGFLKFTTEVTIGTKFSIGRKELSETSFSLNISPLIGL